MEAINNLNKITDLRNNMISYIVNSKATSKMSDKQYDALENKLSQKSFAQLKKEYDTLKAKNQMKNGGEIGENKIDFKNFTIAEFNSFVESINNYGDIEVSVSVGNNVRKEGTYTKKIDLKKLKDLSMSLGDGKEISVVTGSENIYADVFVYDNNYDKGYKEYTISLFSKDDKKGLKSIVNAIIEKFKNGGKIDINELNMPVIRTQFEDEEYEFKDGGNVKVGDKVMLPEIKMRDGKIQFEKVENGEVLYIENGIYGVLNPKTKRIHQVSLNQIKFENGGTTKGFCYTIGGL